MKIIKFKSKLFLTVSIIILGTLISCEEDRFDDLSGGVKVVENAPEAIFDYTINGSEVTFTNRSKNANIFGWNFGDNAVTEDFTVVDMLPVVAEFDFDDDEERIATVILAAGITEEGSATTTATNLLEVDIRFIQSGFIISGINERLASFESNSFSAVSHAWDFGDGGVSAEINPTYEYSDFGTYTVSLVVTDRFGNTDEVINEEVVIAEPGAGTIEAVIIGGDPDDSSSTSQWAIDPDDSSGYNYWANDPLEILVEMLPSGQQKINTSSSVAYTGERSWQIKDPSERFYQAINVEQGVDYTISLFTSSDADAGQTIGTWYVLSGAPADEDSATLASLAIATEPVTLMSDDRDDFEEVTISFNTGENTFSFTEEQLTNKGDNLTEGFSEDSQFVILYFVPNTTIINEEGNKDDVYVDDITIYTRGF